MSEVIQAIPKTIDEAVALARKPLENGGALTENGYNGYALFNIGALLHSEMGGDLPEVQRAVCAHLRSVLIQEDSAQLPSALTE